MPDRALRGQDSEATDKADPAMLPRYAVRSLVHGCTSLALEGALDDGVTDPPAGDLLAAMLGCSTSALGDRLLRHPDVGGVPADVLGVVDQFVHGVRGDPLEGAQRRFRVVVGHRA